MKGNMKKISILLLCIFVFSILVPTTLLSDLIITKAATTHVHDGIEFIEWTSKDSLPDEPGNYCLMNHIECRSTWKVLYGTVNICMNDYHIRFRDIDTGIKVTKSATLNIYSCTKYGSVSLYNYTSVGADGTVAVRVEGNLMIDSVPVNVYDSTSSKKACGILVTNEGYATISGTASVDSMAYDEAIGCEVRENSTLNVRNSVIIDAESELQTTTKHLWGIYAYDYSKVNLYDNPTIIANTWVYTIGSSVSPIRLDNAHLNLYGTPTLKPYSMYPAILLESTYAAINIKNELTNTTPYTVEAKTPYVFTESENTDNNNPEKFAYIVDRFKDDDYEIVKASHGQLSIVRKKYTVSATASEGGKVSGGKTVEAGSSVTLTATANKGYEFIGWFEGENKVCETAEFVVKNADSDKTYTAKFKEIIIEAEHYGVWCGGAEFTSENLVIDSSDNSDIISGSATFEPATYTLTLDNFKYEGAGAFKDGGDSVDEGIAVYYSNPEAHDDLGHGLDIVLIGENEIKCTSESGMCAIYIIGNTTISGSGSLVAESMSADSVYAIYIPSYLDINDATVTAISHGEGESSYGIFTGSLDVNNATVVASSNGQAIVDMECVYESRLNLYASLGGGVDILASYNADGTNAFPYLKDITCDEHKAYKYIKIEPVADSDSEGYEVWLGGIQFTSKNLVIDSTDNPKISGSATFEPSTYTLTLNNFKYEGMGYNQMEFDGHFGMALSMMNPEYDLEAYGGEIVLIGENEITCVAEYFGSCAVYVIGSLTISGSGSLVAKATVSDSCDVEELEGAVGGIVSTSTLTINDASVTAITDVDYDAAYGICTDSIVLDNANVTASGDEAAIFLLSSTPFETVIEGHKALVSGDKDGANAAEYMPGMEVAEYKYVYIEPIEIQKPDEPEIPETPAAFDFTSIRTGNGKNISVDHENKKISVEVEEGDNLQLYVHQKDVIPNGQIKMNSYNGNKVEYHSSGIYRIYSISSEFITVSAKITIGDKTEIYDINIRFAEKEVPVPFKSIRTENGTVTSIDHENKKIYVDVAEGDDNLILYVHQKDVIPEAQIRMKSYNGNKVTYDSNGIYRIYTLGSNPITVSSKVIMSDETLIYDIVANFNLAAPGFDFEEIKCDNNDNVVVDHEAKTIRIYAREGAKDVTLYKKQYDATKGTLTLTSFMGNRVVSDQTAGTYKVCFVKNKEVSVKGNFTLNGASEEYIITVVFTPEWGFETLKADNVSEVVADHDAKTATMKATSDSVVLYIDQICDAGDAQVWMKSYNGNKVTYNSADRTYTIEKGATESLTVQVKITINGETRYYDLTIEF